MPSDLRAAEQVPGRHPSPPGREQRPPGTGRAQTPRSPTLGPPGPDRDVPEVPALPSASERPSTPAGDPGGETPTVGPPSYPDYNRHHTEDLRPSCRTHTPETTGRPTVKKRKRKKKNTLSMKFNTNLDCTRSNQYTSPFSSAARTSPVPPRHTDPVGPAPSTRV